VTAPIAGGALYLAALPEAGSEIHKLDLATGRSLWVYSTPLDCANYRPISNGELAATSLRERGPGRMPGEILIVDIDERTGEERWRLQTDLRVAAGAPSAAARRRRCEPRRTAKPPRPEPAGGGMRTSTRPRIAREVEMLTRHPSMRYRP
jgi:hypothetical protein